MGWGFWSGLGQGLQDASKLPHQYYEDTRQQKLDDSVLMSQAINQALGMQQYGQNDELFPKQLQKADLDLTKGGLDIDKIRQDIDFSAKNNPLLLEKGRADINSTNAQTGLYNANAAEAGHRGRYYDAESDESRARAGLLRQQTAVGGFNPNAGKSGGGSTGVSAILAHADRISKESMDMLKSSIDFKLASGPERQKMIDAAHADAIVKAISVAKAMGVAVTPQDEATAKTLGAVSGALGGTSVVSSGSFDLPH